MKIHIVSHTHWDREWYRPFQYFKVKLSYFFDKLLSILEEDEEYKHFMLDGQMVMIEDYLNLKPQDKERIQKLVSQGKLIIGPWYSQPDEFAPDGESLIRNLLFGINMSKEYGSYMEIGYLPDSFGQSCQIPHILQGCNIKSAVVMRGVPVHKINQTEFVWRGLNGDEVLTTALAKGYSNTMFLPKEDKSIDMRVSKTVKDLCEVGNKNNFLLMNGVDHQLPQPQISQYIKSKEESRNEYIHSTLESYLEDVKKDMDKLVTIEGELISPVTNRVHTSIASSRMYQKTKNRKMQMLLENSVEPLCTIGWLHGANYPNEIINSAWKEMLKNQSHDSICGCCTDEVHKEIDQRFVDVENMGITLKNMHSRAIASAGADGELSLVVFNDSMIKGNRIVNATIYCDSDSFILVDDKMNEIEYAIEGSEQIDAASLSIWSLYLETPCIVNKFDISFEVEFDFNYGYKRLSIIEGTKPKHNTTYHSIQTREIENKFSHISINQDGTFNLLDKESNKTYYNLNTIEDCGDAGDTYNYSPVKEDNVVTNSSVENCDITVKESINKKAAVVSYEMQIPKELTKDGESRDKELVPMEVETEIALYKNIKRIDIRTKILNCAMDHRVRAVFPTGLNSNCSYAETQFGTIKRNNNIENAQSWQENNWSEKTLPIYSNQKFVDINDGKWGLAILNRGLTEYEIYDWDGATIATTLIRGVGFMGKPNLEIRPGRPSGINVATPDAQCLGESVIEYSILAHLGNVDEGDVAQHATIYNAQSTAAQSEIKLTAIAKKYEQTIQLFDIERLQDCAQNKLVNIKNSSFSFIEIDDNRLIISALKKAENEDAVILRVYNPTSQIILSTCIQMNCDIEKVFECDFIEQNKDEIIHDERAFKTNNIKAYSAQTYKIFIK